jgi:hypothetical protein
MTKKQIEIAKSLIGTMSRDDICKKLGVSASNLKRSCPGTSFYFFNRYAANPDMVKEVCKYYEKHGLRETQEKFPELKIRSIVERYKLFSPRQSRWKDNEIIELVKFAGLVSAKKQAEFFNRPLAHEGSIRSVWVKNFKTAPRFMHGLPMHKAKLFVKPECPTLKKDNLWRDVGGTEMVLFCDAVKYLEDDCPDFVKEAIQAMAEFQEKLFGKNPRVEIENILMAMA